MNFWNLQIIEIAVFSFCMWSLTCLVWIYTVTIQKIVTTYQKVGFLFNLSKFKKDLGHLGVNCLVWGFHFMGI